MLAIGWGWGYLSEQVKITQGKYILTIILFQIVIKYDQKDKCVPQYKLNHFVTMATSWVPDVPKITHTYKIKG